MNDRTYMEKAAHAGARKVSLLQLDPSRYLLRSVGAGMGLTIVVFVFWVLTQNLNDISLGRVIAAGFFGVGLTIIVFTNTELFTSNNMYLTVYSAEGRTSWKQTMLLWTACYFGNLAGAILVATLLLAAGSLQLPADHALFTGALHKAHQAGSVIFIKDTGQLDRVPGGAHGITLPGRGCEDPDTDSCCIHLRISQLRALDRQHGVVLNGNARRRDAHFRRCIA